MYFLWFVGSAVEQALGRGRFVLLYFVSALAGSAGALVWTPNAPTVGASGALFGLLGAALILERQRNYVLGGSAMGLILINLILSFAISGISIGGHVGGLIGGILCTLIFSRFGRGHAAYSRVGALGHRRRARRRPAQHRRRVLRSAATPSLASAFDRSTPGRACP